uniref:SprT-like family n=2 Tax=Frankia torreyi TaxID=1856 RepID=Q9AEZ9_9ACTN|nr:hypothetical protein [Frankia torreyi]
MITGSAHQQRGASLYARENGHFGPDLWTSAQAPVPELFLAGELLHQVDGQPVGHRALQTLLHEAAHGLAHVRGIKDTSRSGNRYHNRRYAALATELGLVPPVEPDGRGWSECTLTAATAVHYAEALAALADATLPYMRDPWVHVPTPVLIGAGGPAIPGTDDDGDGQGGAAPTGPVVAPPPRRPGAGRAGSRLSIACGCEPPRRLSVTPRQHELAPILCGACEAPFETTDDPDLGETS